MNICLSADSGTNRHYHNQINQPQIRENDFNRSFRIERDSHFCTERTNLFQGFHRVLKRFHMNRNNVRSEFPEGLNISLRLCDHQMQVKYDIRTLPDGFDYRHAEGYGGYINSVHNIDVKVFCTGLHYCIDILSEMRKIRR